MMNSELKTRVGEALSPVLSPFHKVDGCPLKNVWETIRDEDVQSIQLEFEPGFLSIEVDGEDDTVNLSLTSGRQEDSYCVSDRDPWRQLIGKGFGWGWVGINQQGYLDGVFLGFGSVTPQFSITAIGSSLRLAKSEPIIPTKHEHRSAKPAYESAAAKYA